MRTTPDTRDQTTGPTADADTELQRILTAYAILRDPRGAPNTTGGPSPPSPPGAHGTTARTDDPPIRAGPVQWSPASKL